jgi:cell division protein FtsL
VEKKKILKGKVLFLTDRGFWVAIFATLVILSFSIWSFDEKTYQNRQESAERRASYRKSFDSLESSSRKLDIALREAEETLRMLDDIKKDLDEIQTILKSRRNASEEETRKTQDTGDNCTKRENSEDSTCIRR